MRVLVTGYLGCVGRALTEHLLSEGHTVIGVDITFPSEANDNVESHVASMMDYDALYKVVSSTKPDGIVHLAGLLYQTKKPEHEIFAGNTCGTYNVLTCAEKCGIKRVVLASSINAIGSLFSDPKRYKYFPIDEDHPLEPQDGYSLSKQFNELTADAFIRRVPDMSIVSLRFHYVVVSKKVAKDEVLNRDKKVVGGDLFAYTRADASAKACLKGLQVPWKGHDFFFIVAPENVLDEDSESLRKEFYPDVPTLRPLKGTQGFWNCSKAKALLSWSHDD